MRILTTILAATTLFFASCNQFKKTKSGLSYKITSSGNKDKAKQGQVVKYHVQLKVVGKDSILQNTYDKMPSYALMDSANMPKHFYTEVFTDLSEGDKMEFVLSVDTLIKLKAIPEYNALFKKGGTISGKLEILKVFKVEKDAQADYQKEVTAYQKVEQAKIEKESAAAKVKEAAELTKYLADKKIKAEKSVNGVFVEVTNPGTGAKADSGKQVSVYYKGYTLDGKVFDTNMGPDARSKEALTFVLGTRSVIPGWDEGLKYFAKGGKGRLVIPFSLAYGAQGSPPVIPAFASLVFDIELADIKDAPAAPKTAATSPAMDRAAK